ncbi:hypothetical protein RIF29_28527 [Crotalaria pallida]|uniref:Uncharacterized protein n=1 Tax=Crotalaria pallida TaxID=3830 RepID=A0AAN9EDU1_CROPI
MWYGQIGPMPCIPLYEVGSILSGHGCTSGLLTISPTMLSCRVTPILQRVDGRLCSIVRALISMRFWLWASAKKIRVQE